MSDTSTAGLSGRVGAPRRPVVVAIVGVAAVLIGATLALWAVLGPAVFYEVILAGIAACF